MSAISFEILYHTFEPQLSLLLNRIMMIQTFVHRDIYTMMVESDLILLIVKERYTFIL